MKHLTLTALILSALMLVSCGGDDKKKKALGFNPHSIAVVDGQFTPGQGFTYPGEQFDLHQDQETQTALNSLQQQMMTLSYQQPQRQNFSARISGILIPIMQQQMGYNQPAPGYPSPYQQHGQYNRYTHRLKITQVQLY